MDFERLRILLVDNLMIRRYGNLRMGPGRKLMCGAIRNNWRLCEYSDRDMARLLAPLGIRSIGGVIANKKLVKCAKNFRPDVVLLGHCDYITNETLFEIRRLLTTASSKRTADVSLRLCTLSTLALVIIFSARRWTSLAFALVVSILS